MFSHFIFSNTSNFYTWIRIRIRFRIPIQKSECRTQSVPVPRKSCECRSRYWLLPYLFYLPFLFTKETIFLKNNWNNAGHCICKLLLLRLGFLTHRNLPVLASSFFRNQVEQIRVLEAALQTANQGKQRCRTQEQKVSVAVLWIRNDFFSDPYSDPTFQ